MQAPKRSTLHATRVCLGVVSAWRDVSEVSWLPELNHNRWQPIEVDAELVGLGCI